jgi:dipeptidase E
MAANLPVQIHGIDETAFKVVDGTVEVVSEGHWKRFAS